MDRRFFINYGALAAGLGLAGVAGVRTATAQTNLADKEVESVVRKLLEKEPELIEQAMVRLQQKREKEAQEQAERSLKTKSNELFGSANTAPVLGKGTGAPELVEFIDFQCSFCKRAAADVFRLVESDDIRVASRVLGILGPNSVVAAKVAIAAQRQNKFEPVHKALLTFSGQLTTEDSMRIAQSAGVDMAKLASDLNNPEIENTFQANAQLAQALGIQGTPTFATKKELIRGALGYETLRRAVETSRT